MSIIEGHWYDYPHYFDLGFRDETRREADFLEAAFKKYARRKVRSLLEPACGGGRLVAEMAARHYRVSGFDLSLPMLEYARRRLKKRGLSARLFEADMADYRLPRPVDAAFNTFNSFRHLLTEKDARRFLECTAQAVHHGGIFVLGLHLAPLDADEWAGERWTARHGKTRLTVTLSVTGFSRRKRIENLRVTSLVRSPGKTVRLRSEFPYRLYTAAQLKSLIASVPTWELCDVFDFWYEIDQPRKLDDEMSDTLLVLRRR